MTLSTPRISIFLSFTESKMFSLARLALASFVFVSLSAGAFARSDRLAGCRNADLDARIAGCTDVIARGGQETKRNQITAYIIRGGAYRAKGDFDRAIADLDKAVQLDPRSALSRMERAAIYHAKADLDRAIADYDRALQLDKNSVTAHAGRAKAYRGKGDFDRALADFEEAVRLDPKSSSLHVDRGAVYQTKGDLDQAITDYDEAIELDPIYAPAFLERAKAYRDKHDFERARQDLEAALKLDPQLASANEALDELNRLIAKNATPPAAATQTPPPAPAAAAPMAPTAPASLATLDRLIVLAGGLTLIAFIVWFFWLKRTKGVRAGETSGGYQEVMILVKGGYTPDTIVVRHGKPVRLNFRREETASCSDKVIFADFNKSADLPTGEIVSIELMPNQLGEYGFACPMGMFRGRLIVE